MELYGVPYHEVRLSSESMSADPRRSPARCEACSTALGNSPTGHAWRGTRCKIPACPRFRGERCSQASRRSHTLNSKAKEIGKVSVFALFRNEFMGTQFHLLKPSIWNDGEKKRDRDIPMPLREPPSCIHSPCLHWGRTMLSVLRLAAWSVAEKKIRNLNSFK